MVWTRPPLCGLLAATLASVAAVPNPAARAPLAAELSDGDFKCSVKSDAADSDIGDALSWLCGSGEIDCAEINPGGAHFQPNTNRDHGDWAFDQYYQKHSSNGFSTCYFGGLAAVLPAPLGHFEFLSGGQLLYPTFAKAGMQATDKIPPLGSMTFLSTPFSGNWTGQDSIFSVLVGAASSGVEAHAEVSYDSNGDGIAERTEIYLGAPDGLSVIPEFQPYTNAMGVESFTGDFGEMKNGKELFVKAQEKEFIAETLRVCRDTSVWGFISILGPLVFEPLEHCRRWGIICGCQKCNELRKEGAKHIKCIWNGCRVHEAWQWLEERVKDFRLSGTQVKEEECRGSVEWTEIARKMCKR